MSNETSCPLVDRALFTPGANGYNAYKTSCEDKDEEPYHA